MKNQAASSIPYVFLRDKLSSLCTSKASWCHNRRHSLEELIDSEHDGYWTHPDHQQGWIQWDRNGGPRCLNDWQVSLPWWWYRNFSYPALSLVSINRALAFRDDGIPPKNEITRFPEDWAPDYGDVWTDDNHWMRECARSGQHQSCVRPDDLADIQNTATVLKGDSFYLGWLSKNYGHFLVESLSYLWPLIATDMDITKVRFVGFPMERDLCVESAPSFLTKAFQQFGIALSEIQLVREPVIFERLFVPTPSFHLLQGYCTPMQPTVWQTIQGNHWLKNKSIERKCYLSRRKYEIANGRPRRPLANELEVENLFRKYGFEVIYPETLSFEQQLYLYKHCSVIAGLAGSNMHNAAFMPPDTKVIILAPTSFVVQVDYLITAPKNIRLYYYFADSGDVVFDSEQTWKIDLGNLERCLNNSNVLELGEKQVYEGE